MPDTISALRSLADNPEAEEETKLFLQDDNHVHACDEAINSGVDRAAFLRILGISVDIYRNLRNMLNGYELDKQAKIIARRGRAGGLTIVNTAETTPDESKFDEQKVQAEVKEVQKEAEKLGDEELKLEKHYYPLVEAWARGAGYDNCQITGGHLPGFRWENPDLIAIDSNQNEFTRSANFDITSFEVKLKVEPYGIWQAAHYKRFSVEAYIAFAKDDKTIREQDDGRVFELAIELGLGVLAFEDKKFRAIQWPRRDVPLESKVNETLSNFKQEFTSTIQRASSALDGHYIGWMKKVFAGG